MLEPLSHEVLVHNVLPMRTVGVGFAEPKLTPDIVENPSRADEAK
jgi:hypothetical protein